MANNLPAKPKTEDRMPTIDPANLKPRVTSGSDERGITIPPSTEDRMPEVPVIRPRIETNAQQIILAQADDASGDYAAHAEERRSEASMRSLLEWANRGRPEPIGEARGAAGLEPFPTDRQPPKDQSTVGRVVRNAAEVFPQAVGGFGDAVQNAMSLANPLTDWLNENVADLRYDPTVPPPKTGTGLFVRKFAQFMTGFIPALKATKGMGMGPVMSGAAAGAMADFAVMNAQEARLSDLWKEAGLPQNVLTDYLEAKPGDTDIEGRFKNAAEGVLVGTALDGFMRGASWLRSMKQARQAQAAEQNALEGVSKAREQYGEITEEESRAILGDTRLPVIQVGGDDAANKIVRGLKETSEVKPVQIGAEAGPKGGEVFINFARIDTPEQVKGVIDNLAQRFSGSINEARRGTITQRETAKMADELGLTESDLLARRKGAPFNAETALAARKLWAASAENLLSLAQKAAAPNAGAVDQFAFRRALATHHAIQAEVIGARTETARALAAWRIPAGSSVEKAKAVQEAIEASGGTAASAEIAKRLKILGDAGADPAAISRFAEKGWAATTFDAVREVWINGLLTSPTTHIVNTTSNTIVAFQQVYERGVAALIAEARGADNSVAPGEAIAMLYGMTSGLKDAFRYAAKALKTGETGSALNKIDLPSQRALSADAFGITNTGAGRAVDFVGNAFGVPGRLLGAEDEFFKTIAYRMEVHAQALRQGVAEGLQGEALGRRMYELISNPPENLRLAAADAALYNTFTNQTGWAGKILMLMRGKLPITTFVVPFVRTPVNIFRYTMERTPFAPLVRQWREDVAAGGARADIALARTATGSATVMMALDWADSGLISGQGPADRGEREAMVRQGWKPYSIKVGDRWYQYSRTDPIGSLFGFAADVGERIRSGEVNEDDVDEWQEVMAMAISAVAQVAVSKTYLRGIADVTEMLGDPSRYSEQYVTNLLASFVPMTAAMGAAARAADPIARDVNGPWEAIQARVAFLSSRLPAKRNLWGEQITYSSGLGKGYDMFSPVQAGPKITPSPIDTEIMRLAPVGAADNVSGAAPQRIAKRTAFQGVTVNFKEYPRVYERYVRLAGNELKHPVFGKGAKDYLNDLIAGRSALSPIYKDLKSDAGKLQMIQGIIHQYREFAQRQVMQEMQGTDFAAHVRELQAKKAEAQRPPFMQGMPLPGVTQ